MAVALAGDGNLHIGAITQKPQEAKDILYFTTERCKTER